MALFGILQCWFGRSLASPLLIGSLSLRGRKPLTSPHFHDTFNSFLTYPTEYIHLQPCGHSVNVAIYLYITTHPSPWRCIGSGSGPLRWVGDELRPSGLTYCSAQVANDFSRIRSGLLLGYALVQVVSIWLTYNTDSECPFSSCWPAHRSTGWLDESTRRSNVSDMVYLPKIWEVPISIRTVWYLIIGILDLFDNMGLTLSGLLDSGLPHFLRYFKEEIKDQFKGKPRNKMWPVSVYSNHVLCYDTH